jgi:hypothetical protein
MGLLMQDIQARPSHRIIPEIPVEETKAVSLSSWIKFSTLD